jgi:hypothetical protein
VPDPGTIAKAEDPWGELMAYAESLPTEDVEQVQERILRAILSSQGPTELLDAGAATPASQLEGIPLRISALHPSDSTYEEGPDKYLHVEATIIATGDAVTFSTSARDVVVKLLYASMRGWLPFDAVLRTSKRPTEAGYFPVFLQNLSPDDVKVLARSKGRATTPASEEGGEAF